MTKLSDERMTPMKAIRAKCLDCMCGSAEEVKRCPSISCSLFRFRLGRNPNIVLAEEERATREQRGRENAANLKNRKDAV